MEYGLIGARLGHSYSKIIHEMLCGYKYDLCPLPTEEEARAFLTKRQFRAINVTIPYKKLVMEYCSYIDPRAKAIGAVNTVVNKNGLLYGYNTDYLGFAHLCTAAHGFRIAQLARFGKENRQLLSCGGGVVKRPENLRALHQNGVVLFIDRPVEALAVGGSRPLSSSMEALRTMEAQRRPLYRAAADAVVPNTGTLEDALRAAMEALDEIFDS